MSADQSFFDAYAVQVGDSVNFESWVLRDSGYVGVGLVETGNAEDSPRSAETHMTPDQARAFARELNRMADKATQNGGPSRRSAIISG